MTRLPGRLGTLIARDVMTRDVIVLHETETLEHAAKTLQKHHITGAPVVDAQGHLVGILSLTDVAATAPAAAMPVGLAHSSDVSAWDRFAKAEPLDASTAVEQVASRMSRRIKAVSETTTLVDAARLMCDGHWHRVPVVDARGALRGIISTMDVLAAVVNAADELDEDAGGH